MNIDLLKVVWTRTESCTSYNSYNRTQISADKSLGCLNMEVYDVMRDGRENERAGMIENATFDFVVND
jgi:hypothetical protein